MFKDITWKDVRRRREPVRGNKRFGTATYPQGWFKDKPCKKCSKVFKPKSPSERYCSDDCYQYSGIDNEFKKLYNITLDEAVNMYNNQKGVCKICNGLGFKMREELSHGLVLDHCHNSGKARGWLCPNCNRGIGLLQDSIKNLEKAIEYLR